eukprot:11255258-Heterocapsa_arctica.AAC.1
MEENRAEEAAYFREMAAVPAEPGRLATSTPSAVGGQRPDGRHGRPTAKCWATGDAEEVARKKEEVVL